MTPRFTLPWVGLLLAGVALAVLQSQLLSYGELAGVELGQLRLLLPGPPVQQLRPGSPPSRRERPLPVPGAHPLRVVPRVGSSPKASSPKAPAKKVRPRGVRVSKDAVRRLAKRRAIPSGTPVAAAGGRPAGLRLSGVSAMGIGLRDGDVLTHVAGVPAVSKAAVVQTVLSLRAKKAPAAYARFYRAGQPWNLLVEIPYSW